MRTNYHTHTYRCKHCKGSDTDFVKNAIVSKFDVLGFSDHIPWNFYPNDYDSKNRMDMDLFSNYCNSINQLKIRFSDSIRIQLGLEIEYYKEHMHEAMELVQFNHVEYCIMGVHFPSPLPDEIPEPYFFGNDCSTKEKLEQYEEQIITGMESNLFKYIAHPDLFLRQYSNFDASCELLSKRICETAEKHQLLLEYNISGKWYQKENHLKFGFPRDDFWRIVSDYHIPVIIGYDAHDPIRLLDIQTYDEAKTYLQKLNLNIIQCI